MTTDPTIAQLTFINCYVGSSGDWSPDDSKNIDAGLSASMSDPGLQSVIEQYFVGEDGRCNTDIRASFSKS